MSRYHSYLNSSKDILSSYSGEEPFASFLKKYFAEHKKMGSKDRKQIAHLSYCYFRTGKAMMSEPVEEKILASLFLCSVVPNDLLEALRPEWNEKTGWPTEKKLSLLPNVISDEDIFPFSDELTKDIDKDEFILSHLQQPDLFLRLRPGKEELVRIKLKEAGVSFEVVSSNCLALPNASKLDEIIETDTEAVVQDYSSQQVGVFIKSEIQNLESKIAWDCCAGSGGKSIHLYDLYPGIDFTVSDVRESILVNLEKRFAAAGIKKYRSFVIDLTRDQSSTSNVKPPTSNLILADVPCTGSGTWGRTPEQLIHFNKKKIADYNLLQQKIMTHAVSYLQPKGYLLYSTCSVFEKENEGMVDFITKHLDLSLVKMETTMGYNHKADTMFMALLQNK